MVLSCFFIFTNPAQGKSKDSRYTSYFVVKKRLNDKIDAFVHFNPKFKDDMGTLYYFYIKNGFTYRAHKNLDLSLAYRWVETRAKKTADTDWKIEHRAEFELAPKTTIGKLKITDRNKFEYRYFENEGRDKWRYRNLFDLRYPVKILHAPVFLFCCEELFYDLNPKEISTHWLTAGFDKKLTEDLSLAVYFRIELVRKAEGLNSWDRYNTLGTRLTWYFK